jgi:uncharacterized membrane protein
MTEEKRGFLPRPHIQTLSDLIFGLALSIGAITLIGQLPTNATQVFVAIGQYGFSFLILVSVWRAYSNIMSVLPVETGGLINLNIVLLFLVSIEPYLYYQVLVFTNENWNAVSTAFALDLGLMYLILGFFFHSLANEEKKLVPSGLLKRFRVSRNMALLASAVFFLSMAPIFYSITAFSFPAEDVIRTMPLRGVLWISVLLLSLVRHATEALWSKFKRPHGSV